MPHRFSAALAVWLSLVAPSLLVVQKYLGWRGVLLYAVLAAVGVAVAPQLPVPRSRRLTLGLAVTTFVVVAAAFLLIYPIVNVHTPGAGSDDDDTYNLGARALLAGRSPYAQTTYLGNVLHPLPGAFLLAAPFVLMGTSALQNLFWLTMFFLAVKTATGDERAPLRLAWVVLALSPTVMHQVVTGTGHAANTIYVLLGLWWLVRTSHRDAAAMAWGVALASRANFLFLVPLAWGWLRQHHGGRAAVRATALTCATVAGLALPFYLHDPAHFGPLEAADRLLRFDAVVPYAGDMIVGLMAALAIGLSFMPMDRRALFRNCALVQAVPAVVGTLLGTWQRGRPDLGYAAYGTFAAWFAFIALADRFADTADSHAPSQGPRRMPAAWIAADASGRT